MENASRTQWEARLDPGSIQSRNPSCHLWRTTIRFYRGIEVEALESEAIVNGVGVRTEKPATEIKVYDCRRVIGASDGRDSRWLYLESTSGAYHSYPITRLEYDRALRRRNEDDG